ncbi:MAG: hypothetical protein HY908_05805 [Myxococcales bacterium]|nr:hypothetical protein [Myxococcales bacterium]
MDSRRKIIVLMAALALGIGAGACGKEPGAAAPPAAPAEALGSGDVTVIGQNVCLGCSLKKEQGARAQCSVYGHRHALRVESIMNADGKAIAGLAGQWLHYLDDDTGASLVKGDENHGKRVEVKGHLYAPERVLDVVEVKSL